MKYQTIIVNKAKQDECVYTYLKSLQISENYISNLRQSKENIKLNGAFAFTNAKVKQGDVIEINSNPNAKTSILESDIPLDVVFEDENMLIVNKPENLCCMPNKLHYSNNLAGAIVSYMHKKEENFVLRIINRLDKDTQGLILVAKNAFVYSSLAASTKKVYHALVSGIIDKPFEINLPIETLTDETGKNELKRVISPTGKSAITKVTPIKTFQNASLVELELTNGRTHQIRVHFSHVGHPLIGDEVYGKKSELISHTALVCKKMSVVDVVTKQQLHFEVDYSQSFTRALEALQSMS